MSMRVFVVVAILLIGLMLNGVLIVFEHVPEPTVAEKEFEVEDQFRDMRWTPGTRRQNMQAFGFNSDLVDKLDDKMQAITKRDRKGRLIEALKADSDVGGRLCSNVGSLPSRYFAVGMLIKGEEGTRKSVSRFDTLMSKVKLNENFRPINLEGLYQETELVPNPPADAFALNIAAILLGQEIERIEKEDEWSGGIFGPPSLTSFLTRNPEVEEDLLNYFATMHYMHEVARDPKNQFCGVRVGAGG